MRQTTNRRLIRYFRKSVLSGTYKSREKAHIMYSETIQRGFENLAHIWKLRVRKPPLYKCRSASLTTR